MTRVYNYHLSASSGGPDHRTGPSRWQPIRKLHKFAVVWGAAGLEPVLMHYSRVRYLKGHLASSLPFCFQIFVFTKSPRTMTCQCIGVKRGIVVDIIFWFCSLFQRMSWALTSIVKQCPSPPPSAMKLLRYRNRPPPKKKNNTRIFTGRLFVLAG